MDSSCSEAFDLPETMEFNISQDKEGISSPSWYASCQELGHLQGVTLLTVEKVQTVPNLLHGNGVFLSAMFEDKLFQEQEGALVWNFLPDLNEGFPSVFSGKPCAIWTLSVLDEEFDLEDLLEDRGSEDLLSTTSIVG